MNKTYLFDQEIPQQLSKIEIFSNSDMSLYSYLKYVYKDLHQNENTDEGLGLEIFIKYLGLPTWIGNKIFNVLTNGMSNYLHLLKFIEGVNSLYGVSEDKNDVLFKILDFNNDGVIVSEDVKIFLFYLLSDQKKGEKSMNYAVDEAFSKIKFMKKADFILADAIIIPLNDYFCKNQPFNFNFHSFEIPKRSSKYIIKNSSSLEIPIEENYLDGISEDVESLNLQIPILKKSFKMSQFDDLNDKEVILPTEKYTDIKLCEQTPTFSYQNNESFMVDSGTSYCNKKEQLKNIIFNNKGESYKNYIWKTNKKGQAKKYFLVLINKDIFYYKTLEDEKFCEMHNLTDCYIEEGQEAMDKMYFSFIIKFKKRHRIYYCDSYEAMKLWVLKLQKATNFRNIHQYYDFITDINHGGFGKVILGTNKISKENVAIKIINKKIDNYNPLFARTEIDILKSCHHKNIITYIDSFEDYNNVYIVMEYLQGLNLSDYLANSPSFLKGREVKHIMKEIGEGLKYLHDHGVIHRDLKPQNILLDKNGNVKIIDFGLAIIMGYYEKTTGGVGTPMFIAPEVYIGKCYNNHVDIWSLGIILYYLHYGCLPFDLENPDFTDLELLGRAISFKTIQFPDSVDRNKRLIIDIMGKCLERQIERRINIDKFLNHLYFSY